MNQINEHIVKKQELPSCLSFKFRLRTSAWWDRDRDRDRDVIQVTLTLLGRLALVSDGRVACMFCSGPSPSMYVQYDPELRCKRTTTGTGVPGL